VIISGHVVEKEMLVSEYVSITVRNEVFVSRSETVVFARESELFKDFDKGVLEFESFLLVHFWREIPSGYISSDSGSH
jgi:hypothetical protein